MFLAHLLLCSQRVPKSCGLCMIFSGPNTFPDDELRGRRPAVAPRYAPALWNQYGTAVAKSHRTNNVSEGWHNGLAQIVGKHHPELYLALVEFRKEQGYTEMYVAELAMGNRVTAAPPKKWRDLQVHIENIAADYHTLSILQC